MSYKTVENRFIGKGHGKSHSTFDAIKSSSTSVVHDSWQSMEITHDNWQADKIRQQRHKIEKLLFCYEQQKKCIKELQEYIDQLENLNSQKDEEIKKLNKSNQLRQEIQTSSLRVRQQLVEQEKTEKSRLVQIMNDQLNMYQMEKMRWQLEFQRKQQHHYDQKHILQEHYQKLKEICERKIYDCQKRSLKKQKLLLSKIQELSKQNNSIKQKNIEFSKKIEQKQEFDDLMQLRRQMCKNEKQYNNEIRKKQLALQLLKAEVQRQKNEIKTLFRSNCQLKNSIQSKQFSDGLNKKLQIVNQEQLVESNQRLRKQIKNLKKDIEKWKENITRVSKDLQLKINEINRLKKQNSSLSQQLKRLGQRFDEVVSKQKLLKDLRNQEYEQIENMNDLFKKANFL